MSEILRQVRRGLADPFADEIRLPVMRVSRADARAIERLFGRRAQEKSRGDFE